MLECVGVRGLDKFFSPSVVEFLSTICTQPVKWYSKVVRSHKRGSARGPLGVIMREILGVDLSTAGSPDLWSVVHNPARALLKLVRT
jgi:hypothetical protein